MTIPAPKFKSLLHADLPKIFLKEAIQNLLQGLALSSIKRFFLTFNPNPSMLACKIFLVSSGMSRAPWPGTHLEAALVQTPPAEHRGTASLRWGMEEGGPLLPCMFSNYIW